MDTFSFRTIKAPAEGIYKEKASKFLAFAFPVTSEVQIKEHLTVLKKKYFDAHHHCYAFALGADKSKTRAFDDGEPAHSAGDPILGQIRSYKLTNILVVVVRYFGGTKLGVGGLVSAYKIAADQALSKALIIEEFVGVRFSLRYGYEATPEVMRMVKDFELDVEDEKYDESSHLVVNCKLIHRQGFVEKLKMLKDMKMNVVWEEKSSP